MLARIAVLVAGLLLALLALPVEKGYALPSDDTAPPIHVLYLQHIAADDVAAALASLMVGTDDSPPRLPDDRVRIVADSQTNSLVVQADATDFTFISELVEKLDRPRQSVVVEVVVLALPPIGVAGARVVDMHRFQVLDGEEIRLGRPSLSLIARVGPEGDVELELTEPAPTPECAPLSCRSARHSILAKAGDTLVLGRPSTAVARSGLLVLPGSTEVHEDPAAPAVRVVLVVDENPESGTPSISIRSP